MITKVAVIRLRCQIYLKHLLPESADVTIVQYTTMDTPKVLHLMRTWLRPTESFVENQVLFAENYEPLVLCRRKLAYPSVADRRVQGIFDLLGPLSRSFDRIAYDGARFLSGLAVRAAQEYIGRVDPRVIHVHSLVDAAFYAPLLRDIRFPVLVSGYANDVSRVPARAFGMRKPYVSRAFDLPNRFLALSEDMRNDFIALGIPAEDIQVHYHGIETARFAHQVRDYAARKSIRILSCGRLVPTKGHEVLLKAVRALLDRNGLSGRIEVSIVGDGPMRSRLESLSADLRLADVVTFKGSMPYASEEYVMQYRQADVFALPCLAADGRKEGIPGTLIEAMASGLPVISTVHAGIPEIVRHNVDGLLVGENSVGEMADALTAIIARADLRSALGRAAVARAGEYDVKKQTGELEEIYGSLTGDDEKLRAGQRYAHRLP